MNCPDCGHIIPSPKPEVQVIVEKQRCACGLTETVRISRFVLYGVVTVCLCLFGGCWVNHFYNAKTVDPKTEMIDFSGEISPKSKPKPEKP